MLPCVRRLKMLYKVRVSRGAVPIRWKEKSDVKKQKKRTDGKKERCSQIGV
jgi:hypothetical protein